MTTLAEAKSHLRSGALVAALEAADAGLAAAEPTTDAFWKLLFIKTESLRMQGRTADALALLDAHPIPPRQSQEIQALLNMHRGYLLSTQARYSEAKPCLDKAWRIASHERFDAVLLEVELRRAMFLFFAGELDESRHQYQALVERLDNEPQSEIRAIALAGIGKNAMIRGQYEEAIGWYEQALAIFETASMPMLVATMWSEIGWCRFKLGEDEAALRYFRLAESFLCESGAVTNYQICLGNIGNVFLRKSDYPAAITYYQRALALAKQIKDPVSSAKWLGNLATVFVRMGKPAEAANYRYQAMLIKSQLEAERVRARSGAV